MTLDEELGLQLSRLDWQPMIGATLRILLVVILLWLVMRLVRILLNRLENRLIDHSDGEIPDEMEKRAGTIVQLLRQGVLILLCLAGILVILRELGVEIAPLLASAGIAGLAVGFGAQNLIRDVIAGFFLIIENQVRVGDVAIVNGTGGLVEAVNFRTLVLRDLSGVVHVFPNGSINTLANLTREWSAYVFEISIGYKEDVDTVMALMREVGTELRNDETFGPLMIDDVEIFGIDDFADSGVTIKGRLRTQPIKQWDVGREYRRRLKHAFDREGIEIPFPHRTIYFAEECKPFFSSLAEQGTRDHKSVKTD
jgi:small conductance mechanosensitive channel